MDFRYLVETKNEFNSFMANILIPNIYNDIQCMLDESNKIFNRLSNEKRLGNVTLTEIFSTMLESKTELNTYQIETEYERIKKLSGCCDWFDNLIRASFKSYALFLTWNCETQTSKYADNTFFEQIQIKDFIHRTFVETCNYFRNNPDLFMRKTFKKEIYGIINVCIENSMRYMLPYNEVLQEYLKIDFNKQGESSTQEINKIKALVNEMISNNKYGERPPIDYDENTNSEHKYSSNNNDIDEFINNNKESEKPKSEIVEYEENILIDGSNKIVESPTNCRPHWR